MTTLAFDGRIFAADGQMTTIDKQQVCSKMIAFVDDKGRHHIAGGAGQYSILPHYYGWYFETLGEDAQSFPRSGNDPITLIAVMFDPKTGRRRIMEIDGDGFFEYGTSWATGGSGQMFASAALMADADAPGAIKIAHRLDPATGSTIVSYDVIAGQWLQPPKAAARDALLKTVRPYVSKETYKRLVECNRTHRKTQKSSSRSRSRSSDRSTAKKG